MKKVLNLVLLIAAIGLAYSTYRSVMSPIEFNKACAERDSVVIKRLIDIKVAQETYFDTHNGKYAEDIDCLMKFVLEDSIPVVEKVYSLNTDQFDMLRRIVMRDNGYTSIEEAVLDENQADRLFMDIRDGYLREQDKKFRGRKKYTADYEDLVKASSPNAKPSIEEFSRDTTMIAVADMLVEKRPEISLDSMYYIPFTDGKKFFVEVNGSKTLFQASADFEDYLKGIDDNELQIFMLDKKKDVKQIRKEYKLDEDGNRIRTINSNSGKEEDMYDAIPCRKVGNIEKSNNNAGNWE